MARKQTNPNSEPETLRTKLSGAEAEPTESGHSVSPADQDAIRKYLLGQLTEDLQERVEERLLTEDHLFEELEITEDELIEEFLANDLSQTERTAFEEYFLRNPERQQNLRFAQALNRNSKINQTLAPLPVPWWNPQSQIFRIAAAVAVVALLSGLLWFTFIRTKPTPTFATLTLTISNSDRAEGIQPARAGFDVEELRIVLLLPEGLTAAAGYRVELVSETGETKRLEVTKQDSQSVTLMIPTAQLRRGQYVIKLFATDANGAEQRIRGSYLFTLQ